MTRPGKVAVVTGGGRGLGRAMALGLSRAGFRVAITAARDRAEIEVVAREVPPGQIQPVVADVTYESACVALVEEVRARFGTVSWRHRGGELAFRSTIPQGVRSALRLPDGDSATLVLDGRKARASTQGRYVITQVGAGPHQGRLTVEPSAAAKP